AASADVASVEAAASKPPDTKSIRRPRRRSSTRRGRAQADPPGAETPVEQPVTGPAPASPKPKALKPPQPRKLEDGLRRSPF
ncbi:MAG: hypothetical protein KUG77_01535, partial [Nannocystaceae bacterium]|nr:hypothetical protein [Nannocystaceae bacterium]